jgi:hypothetical protein
MGALAVLFGTGTLAFLDYPEEMSLTFERNTDITADQRAHQKAAFEKYAAALENARRRVVPLAVAEMLLGASMVIFAQRAAVGRSWARSALVQLTTARLALLAVEWALTPDLRKPENDFQMALKNMDTEEVPPGAAKLVSVGLGITIGAITILGLNVPGSRAFYTSMDQLTDT